MLSFDERDYLDFEIKYAFDAFDLDPTDALDGSGTVLSLEPSFLEYGEDELTVLKVSAGTGGGGWELLEFCVTVSGAEELEVLMWQKDPEGEKAPGLLAKRKVRLN